jgi:hypothetical protein
VPAAAVRVTTPVLRSVGIEPLVGWVVVTWIVVGMVALVGAVVPVPEVHPASPQGRAAAQEEEGTDKLTLALRSDGRRRPRADGVLLPLFLGTQNLWPAPETESDGN